jgi:hypothetical protein
MKIRHIQFICLALVAVSFLTQTGYSQTPPIEEEPPVQIDGIKLEKAALPGSQLQWIKIIVSFTSNKKWLDGLAFGARALLKEGASQRVVTGNVRYSNIPGGKNSAIFYISPRATARFGEPELVEILAFYKDTEVAEKIWKNPASQTPPSEWQDFNTYQNVLLNVTRTPWILIDYEKSPDIAGTN